MMREPAEPGRECQGFFFVDSRDQKRERLLPIERDDLVQLLDAFPFGENYFRYDAPPASVNVDPLMPERDESP